MSFLERMWQYVALGAMGIVWEEASPLLGGLAAYDRHLRLVPVIVAVALGTWAASLLLYLLGRSRGRWFRKRWPKFRRVILQSVAMVRRHPWRASLAVRFAYGLRLPLPLACGVARVPLWLFSIGTAISCLAWSLAFSILGWALGRTTERVVHGVREFEPVIGVVVILLVTIGIIWARRRHVAERTAAVLDRERPPD